MNRVSIEQLRRHISCKYRVNNMCNVFCFLKKHVFYVYSFSIGKMDDVKSLRTY